MRKVKLGSSTEGKLRYVISREVATYEARLQKSEETIAELFKKLDEMDKLCWHRYSTNAGKVEVLP